MSIIGNQIYATLAERFYETHHQQESEIVHNSIIWVNNVTDEPCTMNPCEICIELGQLGWQAMNEPMLSFNLHHEHPMFKEVA